MPNEPDAIQVFSINGVPFQARQEPDLSWIAPYGHVFWVSDQQPSGNLCFGVDGPYGKLFIKYAGAQTVHARGKPEAAVRTLWNAMPLYERFSHPALSRLMAHGPAGRGYAAIFAWRDAPALRDALEPVRRLAPERSLKMLDQVFDLHAVLAENGVIAVDFHDGNVLIDFVRDEAVVCDIDLYRPKPAVNDRGRMWGSARFMSPEEYEKDAVLDESTTVYAMGALAFEFFGDNRSRSKEDWFGPSVLYPVAAQATQEKKEARFPSVRAFLNAWRAAVGHCRL